MSKKQRIEAFTKATLETIRDVSIMENISPYDYLDHLHKTIHKFEEHRNSKTRNDPTPEVKRKTFKNAILCGMAGALFGLFILSLIYFL